MWNFGGLRFQYVSIVFWITAVFLLPDSLRSKPGHHMFTHIGTRCLCQVHAQLHRPGWTWLDNRQSWNHCVPQMMCQKCHLRCRNMIMIRFMIKSFQGTKKRWRVSFLYLQRTANFLGGVGVSLTISRIHTAYIERNTSILRTWNVWGPFFVCSGMKMKPPTSEH